MLRTNPNDGPHPDEVLEAYALDILNEEEAFRLESHLAGCFRCREEVAQLSNTAAVLGQSVDESMLPASLRARVMHSLPRIVDASPAPTSVATGRRSRIGRMLIPLAAVLLIGLVSFNIAMNFRLSGRVDGLQRENANLARLVLLPPKESQFMDAVRQLQVASYWLADSDSSPMILEPPGRVGKSQGVLLVANDGRRAMLLVAGMKELTPPSSYQIWLLRQGQRQWVGQVKVDSRGWGSVTLHPRAPLFGFESMQLTIEDTKGGVSGPEDMVLEGHIIAQRLSK